MINCNRVFVIDICNNIDVICDMGVVFEYFKFDYGWFDIGYF